MLLVPRLPVSKLTTAPAEALGAAKEHDRLISIGKKSLPSPNHGGSGYGRKDAFRATVMAVRDDIEVVNKGLGEKTYEKVTRGVCMSASSQTQC